jgi:hypothetical protein
MNSQLFAIWWGFVVVNGEKWGIISKENRERNHVTRRFLPIIDQ